MNRTKPKTQDFDHTAWPRDYGCRESVAEQQELFKPPSVTDKPTERSYSESSSRNDFWCLVSLVLTISRFPRNAREKRSITVKEIGKFTFLTTLHLNRRALLLQSNEQFL